MQMFNYARIQRPFAIEEMVCDRIGGETLFSSLNSCICSIKGAPDVQHINAELIQDDIFRLGNLLNDVANASAAGGR